MLHYLCALLVQHVSALNVVKYITFRSVLATFTALALSFLISPRAIAWLRLMQKEGQPIRLDGPDSHIANKKGTPTMGGLIIVLCISIATLLWADLANPYVWVCLGVMQSFALLGFWDDYRKLKYRNSKGVTAKIKVLWQLGTAMVAVFVIQKCSQSQLDTKLFFPFYKHFVLDLGLFYTVFAYLVIIGASNAVNLTDGLDGLVTLPVVLVASCFALISYLVGNVMFANYLQLPYIPKTGELAVFCAAIIGACLGFLWYNAPPAKIFMGDVGSLSLGGSIGVISVATKHEIVLFIAGGLFVLEALSVIIQVVSFKTRGKRVFKMAPIHHHFEKMGWSESTIVMRFWIIAFVFTLIGLSTLKLR